MARITTLGRIGFCAAALSVAAAAQQPAPLTMPNTRSRPIGSGSLQAPRFDPRALYGTPRESAVAALLAGDDAENIGRNRDRALGMFMLSIQRDPGYAPALFNLGLMSAKIERWDDALSFYQEARRVDVAHQYTSLLEAEVIRVDTIARLESNPDGKRKRQFDLRLAEVISQFNDPAIALDNATKLAKSDPSRWEAPAAMGIMQAALGQLGDAAQSLTAAIRLAPADRRPKLIAASELARQESEYKRLLAEGDAAMEKKQYESAARSYADAWQASPARVETGMQAAIAFLMADQVSLAVQTLTRLRLRGNAEYAAKAGMMLTELGAISTEAKAAAMQPRSEETEQVVDVPERIRTTLGDLRSPEMLIETAPPPALLSDNLKFIHVNDDQLINPASDLQLISSQSLFSIYQSRMGAAAAPAMPPAIPETSASAPMPAPAAAPVAPPRDMPQPENVPGRPQRLEGRPMPYAPPPDTATKPATPAAPAKPPAQGPPPA